MESKSMKAVYIIVNAGFAEDAVELAHEAGATGATIMNARGSGAVHKVFLGITIDEEKELVLCLVEAEVADRIAALMKEKCGPKSPANGICFVLPVDKTVGINTTPHPQARGK